MEESIEPMSKIENQVIPKKRIDNPQKKEYRDYQFNEELVSKAELRHVIGLLDGAKRKLKKVLDSIA